MYQVLVTISYQERSGITVIARTRHQTLTFSNKPEANTAIEILENSKKVSATCLKLYRD